MIFIDIKVVCKECGEVLEVEYAEGVITVAPCKKCVFPDEWTCSARRRGIGFGQSDKMEWRLTREK